ncbi:MAG: hypothetical protein ABSG22_10535 [Sedimentisphaerales bacterium]|jgi:hypothetical protein
MGKTTVDLTEVANKIRQKLFPVYGLRNILSAGLLLFDRLSGDEQKNIIAEANGIDIEDASQKAAGNVRYIIKILQSLNAKQIAIALQFLSPDECRVVKNILDDINPEIQHKKRRVST